MATRLTLLLLAAAVTVASTLPDVRLKPDAMSVTPDVTSVTADAATVTADREEASSTDRMWRPASAGRQAVGREAASAGREADAAARAARVRVRTGFDLDARCGVRGAVSIRVRARRRRGDRGDHHPAAGDGAVAPCGWSTAADWF